MLTDNHNNQNHFATHAQPGEFTLRTHPAGWELSGALLLADRPGELADAAGIFANQAANIVYFHYNRSEDPHLVTVRAVTPAAATCGVLADELKNAQFLDKSHVSATGDGVDNVSLTRPVVTNPGGLLTLSLSLEDKPGALARVARIMSGHRANVLHMSYDMSQALGVANLSLATDSPREVQGLLSALRSHGYYDHVAYTGADSPNIEKAIDNIIGLSEVETFLFKLRTLMPAERFLEISDVITSSSEMRQALQDFRTAAGGSGESMAASEVFTNILHLAAASITRTGDNFSLSLTGPMRITEKVRLYMLTCPTGANSYLLEIRESTSARPEYIMIDSSYGIYYPDARDWLRAHGMNPAFIRQIWLTHADADHAGFAAPLQSDFGVQVYMHAGAADILENENRAWGGDSSLMRLNGCYTTLINRFTDMRPPQSWRTFQEHAKSYGSGINRDSYAGFPVLGALKAGDVDFLVLESLGGHVPAQVFFYAPEHGMLFCADYLIDVPSLSDRTKSTLSIARLLMTSTNTDSRLFSEEMKMLKTMMLDAEKRLQAQSKRARVFPGHGDFYAVGDIGWEE